MSVRCQIPLLAAPLLPLLPSIDSVNRLANMSDYIDFLKEVFSEFGAVSARRMFGGHGLYFDGLMFGLVTQDTLRDGQ